MSQWPLAVVIAAVVVASGIAGSSRAPDQNHGQLHLDLGPTLSASPLSGPIGSTYVATGSGFTASSDAYVTFAGTAQVPTGCTDGTDEGGLFLTDASGDFSCSFAVPSEAGGTYSVLAEDVATSTWTSPVSFTVEPSITVGTFYGPIGSTYVVMGSGFTALSDAYVTFAGAAQVPTACTDGTDEGGLFLTDASGDFSCSFTVPSEAGGTYSVLAEDVATSTWTSPVGFTVSPSIAVSPLSGPIGLTYVVTGSGFTASSDAYVTFNEAAQVPSGCTDGTDEGGLFLTDASGDFSCSFVVPSVPGGTYPILSEDVATLTWTASLSFAVSPTKTVPTLTVNPDGGPMSEPVVITGTNFVPSLPLTVNITSNNGGPVPICASVAFVNTSGGFTCTTTIPAIEAATSFAVQAEDGDGNTASAIYYVEPPKITLSTYRTQEGAPLWINGTGFAQNSLVTADFGSTGVACTSTTTGQGAFRCELIVPLESDTTVSISAEDSSYNQCRTQIAIEVAPTAQFPAYVAQTYQNYPGLGTTKKIGTDFFGVTGLLLNNWWFSPGQSTTSPGQFAGSTNLTTQSILLYNWAGLSELVKLYAFSIVPDPNSTGAPVLTVTEQSGWLSFNGVLAVDPVESGSGQDPNPEVNFAILPFSGDQGHLNLLLTDTASGRSSATTEPALSYPADLLEIAYTGNNPFVNPIRIGPYEGSWINSWQLTSIPGSLGKSGGVDLNISIDASLVSLYLADVIGETSLKHGVPNILFDFTLYEFPSSGSQPLSLYFIKGYPSPIYTGPLSESASAGASAIFVDTFYFSSGVST